MSWFFQKRATISVAEERSANWEVAGDKAGKVGQKPGERALFFLTELEYRVNSVLKMQYMVYLYDIQKGYMELKREAGANC